VRRNRGQRGYRPKQADELAQQRKQQRGWCKHTSPLRHGFATSTQDEITRVRARLTHRPRKTLSYKTPHEVSFKQPLIALTTSIRELYYGLERNYCGKVLYSLT